MISFRRNEIKEDTTKVNNSVQNNANGSNDQISYTHDDWMRDFNAAHNTYKDSDVENLTNNQTFETNNELYSIEEIFKNESSLDSSLVNNQENSKDIATEKETKQKRKIALSIRAKVHLTVYILLALFVFSMLISNALLTLSSSNKFSADANVVTVEDKNLNTIVLPDGSTININSEKTTVKKQVSDSFDEFCDKLEGNK